MMQAISRALELYKNPEAWQALVINGMNEDRSWGRAARQYSELYRALMKDTF
jgi:starch synthase